MRPPRRFFHGWVVVAAAFAVTFVGFGSAYTFSAFVAPLQRDLDASRGSVSLVFSLAGFLYFALGAVSGPLADRWGARRLAVSGMLLVGLGLALASQARTVAEVYLAYGLGVGLGVGCAYVPVIGAVQRWFLKRRALASGLAVSGIGIGTLVMPPLAAWLIAAFGWRLAYLVLAGIAVLVGAGMSLLIRNDPRDHGLAPYGAAADSGAAEPQGMALREAMRTVQFKGLYLACLLCALGVFVPFVHLLPSALGHGLAPAAAALLLGAIGLGSAAGRALLSGVADRVGREAFLVAMLAGMAAAMPIWALAGSFWPLLVFALLFGTCYGGWVAILPAIAIDYFGSRHVGAIIGALYTSVAAGTLVGPSAAGFMFDASHSYTVPIAVSAAANAIAAAVAFISLRKNRSAS